MLDSYGGIARRMKANPDKSMVTEYHCQYCGGWSGDHYQGCMSVPFLHHTRTNSLRESRDRELLRAILDRLRQLEGKIESLEG